MVLCQNKTGRPNLAWVTEKFPRSWFLSEYLKYEKEPTMLGVEGCKNFLE